MRMSFTPKLFCCLLLFFIVSVGHSQERSCGMLEYMEEQMKDPEFARQYEENQAKFKARLREVLANEDFSQRGAGTIVIPVAVHFPTGNEADRACLEALAQNQIDILNADYTATNADLSNWASASSFYPGVNPGTANISFCLAVSNHPAGLDPELLEGNPCVTIGYDFGGGNNVDANWAGYMNFVVRPIGGSVLGFSPLGGSVAAGQAVTINTFCFGSGAGCPGSSIVPSSPFNLGRTTTHELGHFYNLDHTFAGYSCASDDGIADTPNIDSESYGCPASGSVAACTLGQYSLTMDYMDYVDDPCMYLFTVGQTNVIDTYVSSVLAPQFKPDVCTPPTPGFSIVANDSPVFSCPTSGDDAVFNFTYSTILGFNENTTFSATGLPAGATVSFNPTSLSADGNVTMTVGNIGSTAEGEYTITVTGTSSSVTKNVNVLLKNTCTTIQCTEYASAQNLNLPIIDGSSGNPGTPILEHIINVPTSGNIDSMTLNVDITHSYVSDLIIRVYHPNNTDYVDVWYTNCSGGYEDINVTFDDSAPAIVCDDPTVGTYAPYSPLSAFNGMDAQGDWTILVADFFAQDTGVLNDWSLNICMEAPLSVSEFSGLHDFSIYPNPNNGSFTIKLDSDAQNPISVEVFDIRGRSIYNKRYSATNEFDEVINLNNVQSGLYLVKVSDGQRAITKKIIVE